MPHPGPARHLKKKTLAKFEQISFGDPEFGLISKNFLLSCCELNGLRFIFIYLYNVFIGQELVGDTFWVSSFFTCLVL